MQFHTDGKVFKIVRITGPTHNYLGLSFSEDGVDHIDIESMPLGEDGPARLSAVDVCKFVRLGIERANSELSSSYRLKKIQFVLSDSPPVEIYADLARHIVERMHLRRNAYNGITTP